MGLLSLPFRYTIVEASRSRTVYNWLQYFDRETLCEELEERGLVTEEVPGDVAGAPYDADAAEMALIAKRP